MFTEEYIIDELIDFFFAGQQTTQYATQTIVSHFATCPESVKKVRDEFEYFMEDKMYEDESLANKSKKDQLRYTTSFECLNGLAYLNQVVLEALRFNPPVHQGPSQDII